MREPFNQRFSSSKNSRNVFYNHNVFLLEDKPVKIYTLRDIENELHVRKTETDNSHDLTAFYKLLELVGLRSDRRNAAEVGLFLCMTIGFSGHAHGNP